MSILVINSGSSSLKFGLFDAQASQTLLAGDIDWAGGDQARARFTLRPRNGPKASSQSAVPDDLTAAKLAVTAALDCTPPASGGRRGITLVGHRVVHGGAEFRESTLIDAKMKAGI